MEETIHFDRCLSCFARKTRPGPCRICGYEDGLCDPPCWSLQPGTVLGGRYILGRQLRTTDSVIIYLAWDFQRDRKTEVVEYFPGELVTRDSTYGPDMVCLPGREARVEAGKEAFFQRVRLYYDCVGRVQDPDLDFLVRNNTCYCVRMPRSSEK